MRRSNFWLAATDKEHESPFRGRATGTDLDFLRVTQAPRSQAFRFPRHGGREKQRLTVLGAFFHDAAHVGQEAMSIMRSTSSSTRISSLREIDGLLFDVIEQTARRGRYHIAPLEKCVLLLPVAHSAEKQCDLMVHETGKVAKRGLDLHGELASGLKDEAAGNSCGESSFERIGRPKAAVLPCRFVQRRSGPFQRE